MVAGARFGDDLEDSFLIAGEIGFDGLEIPFNRRDRQSELIAGHEGARRLLRLSERYGLEMPSCIAGRCSLRGFPDDDPAVRAEAVAVMLHLIDMCAQAGMGRILVRFFGDRQMNGDERIERAIEGVGLCAPEGRCVRSAGRTTSCWRRPRAMTRAATTRAI